MSQEVDHSEAVLAILRAYVSPPTARSVLEITRLRAGVAPGPLRSADLAALVDVVPSGLRLFLTDSASLPACRARLAELADKLGASKATPSDAPRPPSSRAPQSSLSPEGELSPGEQRTIKLAAEDDLRPARSLARRVAASVFASAVWQTRVVTITSELARNIVQYAGQGEISLRVLDTERGVEIIATDKGPGIPHLASVLGGSHRSQSGMGQGLRGVKAVCDDFEIRCEAGQGTYVRALLRV
ncbi:MAG: ATP-binding protein [Sandaracinus sp.]